jgi:hypothetical protein
MDAHESRKDKLARVAREMGTVLRRQARRRWETVRTAERNERNRHVWRFRGGPDEGERFLHVTHMAMVQADGPAALLEQLKAGQWLDKLSAGPATALLLSEGGRLEPWPQS